MEETQKGLSAKELRARNAVRQSVGAAFPYFAIVDTPTYIDYVMSESDKKQIFRDHMHVIDSVNQQIAKNPSGEFDFGYTVSPKIIQKYFDTMKWDVKIESGLCPADRIAHKLLWGMTPQIYTGNSQIDNTTEDYKTLEGKNQITLNSDTTVLSLDQEKASKRKNIDGSKISIDDRVQN